MTAISPENTGHVHDLDGQEEEHDADEFVDNELATGEAVADGSEGSSTRKPGARERVEPTFFSVSQKLLQSI